MPTPTLPRAAQIVRVTKSDAVINLSQTLNTWVDIDAGGSAASRPLDIVIPFVQAGNWVEIRPAIWSGAALAGIYVDAVTVVAGAKVNQFGSTTTGTTAWLLDSSATVPSRVQAVVSYQVQAGDIENGSVRIRLQSYNTTTTARSFLAGSGFVLVIEGRGPFV